MSETVRSTPPERVEIMLTRVFDAPRELVFAVWSTPEHLGHWWGPRGFTLPVCEMDFRSGGRFRQCMRGPDGHDYWNSGVYTEIVPPERIVFTAFLDDDPGNEIRTTITFAERDGGTEVTVRQSFADTEHARGAEQGWGETLDRLADHVAAVHTAGRDG